MSRASKVISIEDEFDQVSIEPRRMKTNGKLAALNSNNKSVVSNENIPRKLLIELASLSSGKFKVEAKSKYQSVVLPIDSNQKKSLSGNNALQRMNSQLIKDEPMQPSSNLIEQSSHYNSSNRIKSTSSSSTPLENYYVTLKCTIVNKSLALVPPIRIFIPYNYPDSNPLVDCIQLDEFDDDMLPEYSLFLFFLDLIGSILFDF